MTDDRRARLLAILKAKSFRRGHFVLASGKTSDVYLDCRVTGLDAEGATLIGELFYEHLKAAGVVFDALGGLTLGADPLITATSIAGFRAGDPKPGFIIRKEPKGHGLGQWIEGRSALREGDKVVLLDDVITTGGSLRKSWERALSEGLVPVYVLAVVDRSEGGKELLAEIGLPHAALFTLDDFADD